MGLLALPMFFRTVMGEPHTTLEHFLAPLVIHERGYERTCTKTVRFERRSHDRDSKNKAPLIRSFQALAAGGSCVCEFNSAPVRMISGQQRVTGRRTGGCFRHSRKGTLSAAVRRKIAAAQRARWAKVKAAKRRIAGWRDMVIYRVESTSQHLIPLRCRNGSRGVFRVNRCIISDRGETIRLPAMSAKRGNPNWCKPWPAQLGPPIATEFGSEGSTIETHEPDSRDVDRIAHLVRAQPKPLLRPRMAA